MERKKGARREEKGLEQKEKGGNEREENWRFGRKKKGWRSKKTDKYVKIRMLKKKKRCWREREKWESV